MSANRLKRIAQSISELRARARERESTPHERYRKRNYRYRREEGVQVTGAEGDSAEAQQRLRKQSRSNRNEGSKSEVIKERTKYRCSVCRLGLIPSEKKEGERPSTRSRDYLHPRRQIIDSNCGSARLGIGSTDRSARGGKREIMMRLGRDRSHIIFSRYNSSVLIIVRTRS